MLEDKGSLQSCEELGVMPHTCNLNTRETNLAGHFRPAWDTQQELVLNKQITKVEKEQIRNDSYLAYGQILLALVLYLAGSELICLHCIPV